MATLGLVVTACVPGVPIAPVMQSGVTTDRLDGTDRYQVAVSVSGRLSDQHSIPVVYLVSGESSAEAALAAPIAAAEGGALLYTQPNSLPAAVADELVRLSPGRVEVVGSVSSVARSVVDRVSTLLGSSTVERVAGNAPPETAAALSARAFPATADVVFIASSDVYFDALAAASAAANLKAPVLLVGRTALPSATGRELTRLRPGRVIVVGGPSSVSDAVLGGIKAIVAATERVSGPDRYATAAALARRFFPTAAAVLVAPGSAEVGALAAIPLAAITGAPILFTQPGDQLPPATRGALNAIKPRHIYLTGSLPEVIRGELVGFSDGRIGLPTETATYPSWDSGWHDPNELLTIIKATEIAYPSLVHVFSIGKSYEGRDIWAAKISDNVALDEDEPEVLVDALHHAAEHLGVEQALYLFNTLTSGYATDKQIRKLVDEREIWIIFAVNPDGWAYDISEDKYHWWRKNRQHIPNNPNFGVDLNRNYSYMWGCCGGSDVRAWAWNYRGPYAFYAPESKAVADFVTSRVVNGKQQIKTHVTLHTHGEMVLYPMSYTLQRLPNDMNRDDYATFQAMARKMASMNGYIAEQSSQQYPTDGDEIDWLYATYRIFSFTFELYPTEQQAGKGIVYPADNVIARQTARNRSALLYLIDAAACPYAAIGKAAQYCGDSPSASASPSG